MLFGEEEHPEEELPEEETEENNETEDEPEEESGDDEQQSMDEPSADNAPADEPDGPIGPLPEGDEEFAPGPTFTVSAVFAEEIPPEEPPPAPKPAPRWIKPLRAFFARRGRDICCAGLFFLLGALMLSGFLRWMENNVVYGREVEVEIPAETCEAENRIFEEYIPHVNVTVNEGKENTIVNTPVVTVGEVLASLGIYLDDNDEVVPGQQELITDNLMIVVSKVDEVEIVMDEVIRFTEQIDYIQTIPIGQRKVTQNGSDGLSRRVLRQVYVNGVLETETIVSEEIVTKPVTQIVKVGAGGTFTAPDGTRHRFNYYVDVEATAYGGEMFSGLTYTGKQIELGDIAVDPEVIPLGSKVYVMGDEGDGRFEDIGVCSAQDTGRLIVGEKIDIYMGDDLELCRLFGRRPMRVYVMEIGTWSRFG